MFMKINIAFIFFSLHGGGRRINNFYFQQTLVGVIINTFFRKNINQMSKKLMQMAKAERQSGNYEKSVEYYKNAAQEQIQQFDNSDELSNAYNGWGFALTNLKNHQEAIKCYENSLITKNSQTSLYYILSLTLIKQKRYEKAISYLKQYKDNNLSQEQKDRANIYLAFAYQRLAKQYQNQSTKSNPQQCSYHLNVQSSLDIQDGNYYDAICKINKAVQLNPDQKLLSKKVLQQASYKQMVVNYQKFKKSQEEVMDRQGAQKENFDLLFQVISQSIKAFELQPPRQHQRLQEQLDEEGQWVEKQEEVKFEQPQHYEQSKLSHSLAFGSIGTKNQPTVKTFGLNHISVKQESLQQSKYSSNKLQYNESSSIEKSAEDNPELQFQNKNKKQQQLYCVKVHSLIKYGFFIHQQAKKAMFHQFYHLLEYIMQKQQKKMLLSIIKISKLFWNQNTDKQEFSNCMKRGLKYFGNQDNFDVQLKKNNSLQNVKPLYDEIDISRCLYQICCGVQQLNDEGIWHKDLKIQNILPVQQNNEINYKIIDFDKALLLKGQQAIQYFKGLFFCHSNQPSLQDLKINLQGDFFDRIKEKCNKEMRAKIDEITDPEKNKQSKISQEKQMQVASKILQVFQEYFIQDHLEQFKQLAINLLQILNDKSQKVTNYKMVIEKENSISNLKKYFGK